MLVIISCSSDWLLLLLHMRLDEKEHDVSYYYKMNNLKEINRKNHTCYYFNDICRTDDFDFDNVLLDEKSYENVLVHDILSWVLKNHL